MESHHTHTPDKTDRNIKTIVKNFRYEVCPAAFTTKNNLHVHQRDHTGEKPFMCHKCGKQFKRPMNLSIHMSTHNDRKQFGCVFLRKTFQTLITPFYISMWQATTSCSVVTVAIKSSSRKKIWRTTSRNTPGRNHSIALGVTRNSRGRISSNVICPDTNSLRSLLKKMAMI